MLKFKTAVSKPPSFEESLNHLLTLANGHSLTIKMILKELKGRGYPALVVLISLPFCLPIQIPGFSTPFGLILFFIGLRIAFGKRFHWPKSLLNKEISYATLEKLIHGCKKVLNCVKKWIHPRWTYLHHPFFHIFHGLLIALLGLILALPLPIPFSNILTALPLIFLGIGLLEDDGLWLSIGYILSLIPIIFLFWLIGLAFKTIL